MVDADASGAARHHLRGQNELADLTELLEKLQEGRMRDRRSAPAIILQFRLPCNFALTASRIS